jgi:hypothetical protein
MQTFIGMALAITALFSCPGCRNRASPQEMDQRCRQGDLPACSTVLQLYCQQGAEEACKRIPALQAYIQADQRCQQGDRTACAQVVKILESNCQQGSQEACEQLRQRQPGVTLLSPQEPAFVGTWSVEQQWQESSSSQESPDYYLGYERLWQKPLVVMTWVIKFSNGVLTIADPDGTQMPIRDVQYSNNELSFSQDKAGYGGYIFRSYADSTTSYYLRLVNQNRAQGQWRSKSLVADPVIGHVNIVTSGTIDMVRIRVAPPVPEPAPLPKIR